MFQINHKCSTWWVNWNIIFANGLQLFVITTHTFLITAHQFSRRGDQKCCQHFSNIWELQMSWGVAAHISRQPTPPHVHNNTILLQWTPEFKSSHTKENLCYRKKIIPIPASTAHSSSQWYHTPTVGFHFLYWNRRKTKNTHTKKKTHHSHDCKSFMTESKFTFFYSKQVIYKIRLRSSIIQTFNHL